MRKLVFTLIAFVLFSSAANAAVKWNNSSGNKNKNIPNGNCEERFSAELKEPESVPWVEGWSFEESFEEEEELNVPSYLQFTEAKEVNGGREHSQPVVRAVADFDGDGFDDFLIVFHETRRHASIVYSDGAGGMKLVDLPASTTRRLVREVSLADFNGDGLIDIYGHTAPHDWRTGWRGDGAARCAVAHLDFEGGSHSLHLRGIFDDHGHLERLHHGHRHL